MQLQDNIIGFHHVSIKAQNFEETLAFYQHLGFEPVHHWSLPEFNLERCAMLYHKAIKYYIEICDKNALIPTQGRPRRAGDEYIENALLHICFVVRDADAARIAALHYGATDLSEGSFELALSNDTKTVQVKNSLVYSPNGEVIEFLEQVNFN
ncbi:VOC family protein [Edaphocola aurantiacus]|uniref:VOC family protein n=1 Tax=Edaphocola aurantiacus TaxID=2601682 RepID=UPI001C9878FC|nr:VOC family protein [Edaphocola aurantiacus]